MGAQLDLTPHFAKLVGYIPNGTGGDNLEGMPVAGLIGADINGLKAANAVTHSGFAYMVWDRLDRNIWSGTLFDTDGKPINKCRLADRSLSCGSFPKP